METFTIGSPGDMSNYITAVIHEGSFDKLAGFIDQAKKDSNAEIIAGGGYDKSKGYFIEPTVIKTNDPKYTTMCTELFGPVVTVYVFEDDAWEETLHLVDQTSEYALTGAVFSEDRYALEVGVKILENAAGNFYINDKPTGAVVGQQPFGGAFFIGIYVYVVIYFILFSYSHVRAFVICLSVFGCVFLVLKNFLVFFFCSFCDVFWCPSLAAV